MQPVYRHSSHICAKSGIRFINERSAANIQNVMTMLTDIERDINIFIYTYIYLSSYRC